MTRTASEKLDDISALISNTPLIRIDFLYKGEKRVLYAKAEYYNLTGSIKDRAALYMLKKAYEKDEIKPGDIIAEATSGNTGISFAAIGACLGHKVKIFMPDRMSRERIALMESFGAGVTLVSKEEGGFLDCIDRAEKLCEQGGVYLPRQFSNPDNTAAHFNDTGNEIVRQLSALGLRADGVAAGIGTGGTIMGLTKRLKQANPNLKAFPIEPASSPTLSTGYKVGSHRIEGISDEFIPDLVDLTQLDDIIAVDDGDAIITARMLSEKLGIGVGISSGANFIGALAAQQKLGKDSVIVTVFPDDNKKYLSTDYSKPQEVREGYYSNNIELVSMTAYK
jgi:cysteine synthase A